MLINAEAFSRASVADFVFSNLDGQMRALSRLALFHATSVVAVLSFSPTGGDT